jgi:hypothetical protein
VFTGLYSLRFFLCARFYLGYAAGFDQICDPDPPMRIQDSSQPFFFILSIFATTCCGKHARDLGKDTNRMDRLDVCNDIAVDIFVLQEKSTKVRLAAFHHLLDGGDDMGITDDDCFVESGEERATCYRKCEDLRIDFRDRLFGY